VAVAADHHHGVGAGAGRAPGAIQTTLQNEKTDEELFEQFRSGNGEGFEKLVHRYEGELFGYLNRYLHNRSQAEDVFQNCFMQVYQKAGLFEKGKIFRPWLYSIATHLAIDETRRSKRRTTLSLDKSSSQDPGEGKNNLLEGLESSVNRPDRLAMEEEKKKNRFAKWWILYRNSSGRY